MITTAATTTADLERWLGTGRSGPTFNVVNPATEEILGRAPALTEDGLEAVFQRAETAQIGWAKHDETRCELMRQCADVLDVNRAALQRLLTLEQGKPLYEAGWEILGAARWLRYYANLELRDKVIRDDARGYEVVSRQPLGVVGAITPWNFPVLLSSWKFAPALRAGNTVVVKPSPYTPLTTLAIGELFAEVLPPGVLQVATGPDPLGAQVVGHRTPRKISFTGSTATGRRVGSAAMQDLKRVTLELGGNDAAIVLDDVDVEKAAAAIFDGAFLNNGQVCIAIKRVYVPNSIKSEFVSALAAVAQSATLGKGTDKNVRLGPLNNEAQRSIVEDLVTDARNTGARIVTGGSRPDRAGYFFEPTIIDGVKDGSRVVDEEQFGPVLPIVAVHDEDEAIQHANSGMYGLTASVWSSDIERAYGVADRVDAGQVAINDHASGAVPHLPFGGRKWSGVGVENGIWGLDEFCEPKVILGPGRRNGESA